MPGKANPPRTPPIYRTGIISLIILAAVLAVVWLQFRGELLPRVELSMIAPRAGLSMDPGAKVTYNGVAIGRVSGVEEISADGTPRARFTLELDPQFIDVVPANVHAEVEASTAFGNKYISLSSPKNPAAQHIHARQMIDATHVTTEFNTVFETLVSISEKIDPVKVNETLAAAAEGLHGMGAKVGEAIDEAGPLLDDAHARMPQIHHDITRLGALTDVYADASPHLWNALQNLVTTAASINANQANLDAALLAATGLGDTVADIFTRGGPYLRRAATDLLPTTALLDAYSPELLCTVRKTANIAPKIANLAGGNGYSLQVHLVLGGAVNPFVYPDNLPRTNATGGPEGRPGCWQDITRDLFPAPALVMDSGAAVSPYNHLGIGTPWATEYVWGRQMGENTINP
jgi:phospholipid/cholesterol/gamma-HCH transport system substrate-binding protein